MLLLVHVKSRQLCCRLLTFAVFIVKVGSGSHLRLAFFAMKAKIHRRSLRDRSNKNQLSLALLLLGNETKFFPTFPASALSFRSAIQPGCWTGVKGLPFTPSWSFSGLSKTWLLSFNRTWVTLKESFSLKTCSTFLFLFNKCTSNTKSDCFSL